VKLHRNAQDTFLEAYILKQGEIFIVRYYCFVSRFTTMVIYFIVSLDQGWRIFLRACAKIADDFGKILLHAYRNFGQKNAVLETFIIIIDY
jgi:hypothetical protein